MNEFSKKKESYNDVYYNLNNSNDEDKEDNENINKKKTLKKYKFHMLHHNGLLKTLKKNGIDINLVDNIFNKNEALFIELLKNNDQNDIKKSLSEIFFQNNKNTININEQTLSPNTINIAKSYYESYGKKNNSYKQAQFKVNQLDKDKKKETKINDEPKKKSYSNYFLNCNKIKTNKRYSLESNRLHHNNNSLNNSTINKLDESKNNTKNKKRRASVQLISNKVYLSIDEDNNINNEEQVQKIDESNYNIPYKSNEKINKIKQYVKINNNNPPQKFSKRSNSTFTHMSNNSNNNYQNNENNLKNSLPGIKKYNKIFYVNSNKKPKFRKNNSYIQPYFIKGGVNFKKMLSRAYLDKLSNNVENIYSTITPNYLSIEPKCIMKVKYKNKKYNFQRPPFKGLSADYTFDINKIFFKYNNHIPPKTFEFQKMAGRGDTSDTKLPSFMIGLFDRKSCITFNEKNLKMNSYSNGQLKESISSFNDKKSFNYKLNEEKNKRVIDKDAQIEFENLVKKIIEQGIINNDSSKNNDIKNNNNDNEGNNINNSENKIINSIPFRIKTMYKNFMSEYNRSDNQGDKVDGITFKSFKNLNKNRKKYCKEYNDF